MIKTEPRWLKIRCPICKTKGKALFNVPVGVKIVSIKTHARCTCMALMPMDRSRVYQRRMAIMLLTPEVEEDTITETT